MKIQQSNMTARGAAEYFAANYSDEPRKVGCIVNAPNNGLKFQLDGGVRWYEVRMLEDFSGWEVKPESST